MDNSGPCQAVEYQHRDGRRYARKIGPVRFHPEHRPELRGCELHRLFFNWALQKNSPKWEAVVDNVQVTLMN